MLVGPCWSVLMRMEVGVRQDTMLWGWRSNVRVSGNYVWLRLWGEKFTEVISANCQLVGMRVERSSPDRRNNPV